MRRRVSHARCHRAGLAPLELTLALPLLLMLMALMVLIGTAGAWRVRTNVNSRHAVFRAMYPRTTDDDPRPSNWWPDSARMDYRGGGAAPFSNDPFSEHEVVRGPSVTDFESGNSLRVLIDSLDMTDGMSSGYATVDHEAAMWPRLGVRNNFSRDTVLFAGQTWQYGNMGIPWNWSRRIEYTYDYELSKYNPDAAARTLDVSQMILNYPMRGALAVLDSDDELHDWFYPASDPWHSDDFYPRPPVRCMSLEDLEDPMALREIVLEPLLERIQNVPRRMAQRFYQMYWQQLQILEGMDPRPPDYAQKKAELERKMQQLADFFATL